MSKLPKYEDLPVSSGAPPNSSWGLWGSQDQLGCLNLLSPQCVLEAATTVSQGQVFSLNASLELFEQPLFGRPKLEHHVTELDRGLVRDETLSMFNTQCSTQWDGLRHAQSRTYGFYNDLPEKTLSISTWAERGIAGRGVLLDLATYRAEAGRPLRYDEPDAISADDLQEAAQSQAVDILVGDILIVHTGWLDWARQNAPEGLPVDFSTPGLQPSRSTLAHVWNLHIAALASDTPAVEVWPPGASATSEQRYEARTNPAALADVFMHADLLALLGLPLGELWDTGRLAEACHAASRWDFLFTSAPLNTPGGVASPGNALAIL